MSSLIRKALRAEEELLRTRPAFGRHVRIAAVPFERFGTRQIFKRTVVDDVFAEAVGLEIPLQAVDGGIEMAIGTAKVTLKGEFSGKEKAFSAAERIDRLWTAQINRGNYPIGPRFDDGDVVVETVCHVEPVAIFR